MSFLISGSTSTTTTTTRVISPIAGKRVLSVGINEYPYPENRLRGCVNDATDWSTYLSGAYGFTATALLDSQATHRNFKEQAGNYLTDSKSGDYIVITYSGHGSNVKDYDGDEPDGRDECLCLYDKFFIDDELRVLFKNIHPEAILVFISDSCHSGTVTRAFLNTMGDAEERLMPRYLPPKDDEEARNINLTKVAKRIFYPEENMNEILISGCLPTEYSYDARINGRNNGAMTAMALQVLKSSGDITFKDFYAKLRQKLPSRNYPQTPQLEGSEANKNRIMFR